MTKPLDAIRSTFDKVWAALVAASSGFSRKALAWGGLALAGVILLSVNLFTSSALRGWSTDLTEDGLFTISDGTKRILHGLDEPINARLYFSKKLGELAPQYASHFERVRALLEQYRDISGGRLELTILDPEPFSDAEDRAVAAGMRGIRLNAEGEVGYFGLSATNATDNEERIALMSPERESFLEYDVTKLIYALANPKKRVVGLITALPIDGGTTPVNMQMGQQAQQVPPWLIMDQIREFFEVVKLEQNLTEIPSRIDVLMVAQPTALTPQAAYAIDQYALKGGKMIVFIDPTAEAAQMSLSAMGGEGRAELNKVLKAWGVGFDATKVAADIRHARRVQFGGRDGQGMVTEFVAWLGLGRESLDAQDVVANGIDVLNLASAGVLTKVDGATTTLAPILKTSTDAMEVDSRKVGMGADPLGLIREYKPGGRALTLAARVSGEIKSAFPDGPPSADKTKTDGEKAGEAKSAGDTSAEPPKSDASPAKLSSHLATGRINAIVVADSDLLADRFWAERREVLGQQMVIPSSNNAAFVVGALENLSGSDALIALRGRGVRERPFTWVEEIRRESERQFREKEEGLTKKLAGLQEELAKLETTGDGGTVVVTDTERQAIEKFRSEMLDTRRELRSVKLALRHDIDNLDAWLKFANIALVPIGLGLAGLGWAFWRARRQTSK